jgi:hypothetical protein
VEPPGAVARRGLSGCAGFEPPRALEATSDLTLSSATRGTPALCGGRTVRSDSTVMIRDREYALSIDIKSSTIIDTVFTKAAVDEKASTIAAAFRGAYERGEWTSAGLSAAIEVMAAELCLRTRADALRGGVRRSAPVR